MNYRPLPTDTEDSEIVEQAERAENLLRASPGALLSYIKSTLLDRNEASNEHNKYVELSKQKQLELTERYYALAEKYNLLSDKYSDLIDKYILLKEQHDSI